MADSVQQYDYLLEPSDFLSALRKTAAERLTDKISVELAACNIKHGSHETRQNMCSHLRKILPNGQHANLLKNMCLFHAIRSLNSNHNELFNIYWDEITKLVAADHPEGVEISSPKAYLLLLSHNYMYFNNNMSGTYRHYGFEQLVCRIFKHDLQFGMSHLVPKQFIYYASFVIAYGSSSGHSLEFIVNKIESMATQFTTHDCRRLARSVWLSYRLMYVENLWSMA